jgi:Secretion system C-terminal sorting domain/SprB repeat
MKNIYASLAVLVCSLGTISRAQQSEFLGYSTVFQSTMINYEVPKDLDSASRIKPNFKGRADAQSFDNSPHQPDWVWQQHGNLQKASTATTVWSVIGLGANLSPPDPSGDADSLVYIQGTNGNSGGIYRVLNKNTGAVLNSSLTMATLGGPAGAGDPIILYHKATRQWVITEFSSTGNKLIVHVSPVGSYTGTYFTSSFTCPSFPDYPKYSIYAGADALMVSSNEGAGSPVYAIKLSAVLAGTTSPFLRTTVADLSGFGFQAITPVDLEGNIPFPAGQKPIYIRHKDDEVHGGATAGTDKLEIWQATVTWTGTPSITVAKLQDILITDFDSDLCGLTSFSCFPQPGTTNKLDPLREVVMYKPVVRIFSTHQAMVLAFTTDVSGANRGGVRWVELRRATGSIGTWTKYQEGTYAPGTVTNRWMPAINIDKNGSILLAYSTSSAAAGEFPSLKYTGRKACDALGTMTVPETTIIAGTSAKTGDTRWGDYFHMAIDAYNEETFYFTGDYMANGGSTQTRIAAIKINREVNDIKLVAANLVTPAPICTTDAVVALQVQNFGTALLSGGTIKYQINNGGFTNQNFTSTINTDAITAINMNITNVASGLNTVKFIVSTANGISPDEYTCNDTLVFTFTAVTNPATVSTVSTAATCGASNGAVAATVAGGLANGSPLSFTINNGPAQGSGNFTGLIAGNYTVVVTDPAGCVFTSSQATVAVGVAVLATQTQTNILCAGSNTGIGSVVASGGLAPYTYLWDNGSITASVNNLAAGNHTCTITDQNGCTNIQSFMITQTAVALNAILTPTNAMCGMSNGSVNAAANGGLASYSYLWTFNNSTNPTLSGLPAGSYTCVITDANNCSITKVASISSTTGPILSSTSTAPLCFGATNGTATVSVVSGNGPYTYAWSPSGGSLASATGLASGMYTCQVTGSDNCTTFQSITIAAPQAFTASTTLVQAVCGSQNNGSIQAATANGQGTVSYLWSNNATIDILTNLTAGTYSVTATDGNGCTAVSSFILPGVSSPTLAASSVNVLCNGGSTGSATMLPSNGQLPYVYAWSGAGGTTAVSNPIQAGTYVGTLTDANNCVATTTVVITEPSAISAAITASIAPCNGGTGGIIVTGSGGTGLLTYNTNGTTNTTGIFTGLAANPYTVLITDANLCTYSTNATVTQPIIITINATPTMVSCFGGNNGTIQVTAAGGTGTYTYSKNGTAYQISNTFSALAAGTYTVYAKDANGCIKNFVTTITQPTALVLTGVATVNSGANNGTITLTGSGGTLPYTYNINGGTFGTSTLFSNLAPGNYTCIIKDDNGCSKTIIITVGSVGLNEEINPEEVSFIGLYPNPTTGQFTLNLSNVQSDIDVRIFNTEGRMIAQFSIANEKGDVSKLFELSNKIAPGVYFMGIYEENKQPKIVKIEKM